MLITLVDKIKRFFWFTQTEIKYVLLTIVICGFMVGYNDGLEATNHLYWFWNFLSSTLIFTLALLVHLSAQRIAALVNGFKARYEIWYYGIAIGLILTFLSNGKLWILIPGSTFFTMLEKHRLGKFRYGLNYWAMGWSAIFGPISNIVLAWLLSAFRFFFANNILLEKAIIVNLVYGMLSMLFIPPLDGMNFFYTSRLGYAYVFGACLGVSVLIFFKVGFILTLIGGLLTGTVIWGSYYLAYEMGAWEG